MPAQGGSGWRYTLRIPSWSQVMLQDGEPVVFFQVRLRAPASKPVCWHQQWVKWAGWAGGATATRQQAFLVKSCPTRSPACWAGGGDGAAPRRRAAAEAQRGAALLQLCHALPAGA